MLSQDPTQDAAAATAWAAQRAHLERRLGLAPADWDSAPTAAAGDGVAHHADAGDAPLSFPQRRLWFLDQLHRGDPAYNCAFVYRLTGPVDAGALARAIDRIVRRHDALRTTFRVVNGDPMQVVVPDVDVPVQVEQPSAGSPEQMYEAALRVASDEALTPFDLTRGPLLRVRLLQLAQRDHVMLVTFHHIVVDGWSMMVFFAELERCYDAELTGGEPTLPTLACRYADFAVWQRARAEGTDFADQLQYWHRKLDGLTPLELPTDRPHPAVAGYAGAECVIDVPVELATRLRALCRSASATPFMGLLAALKVLLARYSGSNDVAVGAPVHGRLRPELEHLIGFFINIVVMRTDLSGGPTFRELLDRVRQTCASAYDNQEVPFERLVDDLRPARQVGAPPLVQVLMQITERLDVLPRLAGVTAQRIDIPAQTSKFDLLLDFREHDGGFRGHVQYRTELFDEARVIAMLEHFVRLLDELVSRPDDDVFTRPMLSDEQYAKAAVEWNRTSVGFPSQATLHGLFEQQADRRPDAIAVRCGDRVLTYACLDHAANRMAHRLRSVGVGRGAVVGLLLDRSVDLVVSMLGILKAGAAYVPLDPSYPRGRLAMMISDAGVAAMVSRHGLRGVLPDITTPVLYVEDGIDAPTARPEPLAAPRDLAYLIFTSGSTGRPKGALLDHRGRVNNFTDYNRRYGLGPNDRVLAVSSPSFDMCVYDVFGILAAGGTVVMPLPEDAKDPKRWISLMLERRVSVWHSVPALLGLLVEQAERDDVGFPDLRLVILGGDWIPVSLPDRIRRRAPAATIVSAGGATEVSMDSTIYTVDQVDPGWRSIPYGRPMANQLCYALDAVGEPMPVGVPGELFIGGVGVGWGYHARPSMTAERFVPNPFSGVPGDRMYRTGDIVRYGPDGLLELLGRRDLQVKIHGLRIELGEIEAALRRDPAVAEVIVAAKGTGDDRRLVGYVLARPGYDLKPAVLRERVAELLPAAMVPASIFVLTEFPLTPNGKVDRGALPEPTDAGPRRAWRAPRGAAEQRLVAIWSRILQRTDIGVEDNFFDLGGDSFAAIRAMRAFHPSMPAATLFTHPTVEALAACDAGDRRSVLIPLRSPSMARFTVVAIPYGGGNAISYSALAAALPEDAALLAVALPGHDFIDEPLVTVAEMARRVAAELDTIAGPVVLYGQCVGSALTIALARRLQEEGRPPRAVFLGGALLPRDPLGALRRDAEMSDAELADFLGTLGGLDGDILPSDRATLLRLVRHDRCEAARYFADSTHPVLPSPVHCVIGVDDPTTTECAERYQDWTRYFASVRLVELAGAGHYFVKDHAAAVADVVVRAIDAEMTR